MAAIILMLGSAMAALVALAGQVSLFPMESSIAQEARQNLARRYYSI